MKKFWAVLDGVRDTLDTAVQRTAESLPAFAALLARQDPAAAREQARADRAREGAALERGEWAPYLAALRQQGAAFARMGISFRDWYALLQPYRQVIWTAVLPSGSGEVADVLSGMNAFLDLAMSTLAEAYIAEKQELVRSTEHQLELHQRMFQSSSLGKLILEWEAPPDRATFKLVACNPASNGMVGRELSAQLGQRLTSLGDGALLGETPSHLARAMETGEPQSWTARGRQGLGAERIFDVRAFSLGGKHVGVVFEDVARRHALERDLAQHVRDLERSNRDLDEFAYVASHDLKAPLRDIDNLASWIAEDVGAQLPEKNRKHLKRLQDRVTRMERLLEDLLQYSRAGRVNAAPEDVPLRELVQSAVELAGVPAGFKVEVRGEAAPLRAPRAAVELVVRNLVANAIKHHDKKEGVVAVELADAPDAVTLAIRDDGPGIPPEFHERVFRMFQTLRPRDEVEGSGMGLAIVKKTVESHGGTIRLETPPPRGCVFTVRWPRGGVA